MQKLILVRHGETKTNTRSVLHKPNDPDVLTTKGKNQIKSVGEELRKHNPHRLFCSKEKRALESAQIISESLRLPVQEIGGLEERNWGVWSGKTWPEIQEVLDQMTLDQRYTLKPPSGESWEEFEKRLISSLKEILIKHSNETIVIVTHSGAIRALMPFLLGVPREESFNYDPPNASLTAFNVLSPEKFEQIPNEGDVVLRS